jgi:hypothetical protein
MLTFPNGYPKSWFYRSVRRICLVLYLPIRVAVTIYLSGPLSPNTCGSHDISVWSFISQYVWQSRYICLVLYLPIRVAVTIYLSGPLSPNTCGSHDISEHWLKVKQTLIKLNFKWVVNVNGTRQHYLILLIASSVGFVPYLILMLLQTRVVRTEFDTNIFIIKS